MVNHTPYFSWLTIFDAVSSFWGLNLKERIALNYMAINFKATEPSLCKENMTLLSQKDALA